MVKAPEIITRDQLKDCIVWAYQFIEKLNENDATKAQTLSTISIALSAFLVADSNNVEEMEISKKIFRELTESFTEQMFSQHIEALSKKYNP